MDVTEMNENVRSNLETESALFTIPHYTADIDGSQGTVTITYGK